jgi:isoleucyl-tRNA synthetase
VHATRAIERYIDDLSTWYVRRSRGRKDEAFFATLYGSLMTASKVIAPIMPYIAEVIYRALGGEFGNGEGQPVSVHLSDWPARADIADADLELLRDMETVRSAASLGLAERKSLGIPVRQPLPALKLKAANPRLKAKRELLVILAEEVNVKEIVFDEKLRQDAALDVSLTPELRDEGLVRALERVIQEARKKEGLKVGEYAALLYATDDEDVKRAIGRFNREKTYISAVNESEESAALKSCDIGGKKISFRLERKGG